ncbi:MAG: ABC transporter substrate-binding protein [Gaiellales bacterium]
MSLPTTGVRTRALFAVALLAVVALVVTACGGSDSGSSSASGGGSSEPVTLRIGYQAIPNGDTIVRQNGWLEEALKDKNVTVEWTKFESGGDVNTAFVAGDLDIGLAGSSPVTKGLSEPLLIPYQVPWIFDVIGTAESLVVSNKSGITDLKGLEGKKIGAPFGSTAHFSLLAALEQAGVDPAKVDIIDLEPADIQAAWERGDIDGAYVWLPVLAELRKDGKTLITSADLAAKGKTTADLAVVSNDFATKHSDIVQIWADQEARAVDLFNTDQTSASEAIGAALNLEPAEALAQAKELIWLDAKQQSSPEYLGTPEAPGAFAIILLDAATFLKTQDAIDAVPALDVFQKGINGSWAAAVTPAS